MVAFKHNATNVSMISVYQEDVYWQEDELSDNCHDSDDHKDSDEWLLDSTVNSDCIDFGSCAYHQGKFPDAFFFNPYGRFMPRVKQLVSIVEA